MTTPHYRSPVTTLWVCVDCLLVRETGESTEAPDREPWTALPDADVTLGALCEIDKGEHYATDPDGHAEECERLSFSRLACDACGSALAGERHAYTLWE